MPGSQSSEKCLTFPASIALLSLELTTTHKFRHLIGSLQRTLPIEYDQGNGRKGHRCRHRLETCEIDFGGHPAHS